MTVVRKTIWQMMITINGMTKAGNLFFDRDNAMSELVRSGLPETEGQRAWILKFSMTRENRGYQMVKADLITASELEDWRGRTVHE